MPPGDRPSRALYQGRDRAAARSFLYAIGLKPEDLDKPFVGVSNCWLETMPCNFGLRELAVPVKAGIRAAGANPMEFNTIAISDGITMGSEGMKASLVSREVIADSIELVGRGHQFDAMCAICACDKTIPASAMALARLDRPGVLLYGGSIMPGRFRGKDVAVGDVYEAIGAVAAGKMSEADLTELELVACPGAGACGGQYTANTMSMLMEVIGLSPFGFNSIPATDPDKHRAAETVGRVVLNALENDLRPSRILTRRAFDNAIAAVAASGGSTNAVLHLLALAREVGVELHIDDIDRISRRTPLLCDLKPGGRFAAVELHRAGGIGVLTKRLIEGGFVDGDAMTVTGRTLGEECESVKETPGQEVVAPLSRPLGDEGGLVVLRGSLAPEGSVVKVTQHTPRTHRGPARVFNREEDAFRSRAWRPDQGRRHRGDPVRGAARRSRHARDAAGHRCHRRRGPWRNGCHGHRRPLFGCDSWLDDRSCRAGGRAGRSTRRPEGRRPRHDQRGRPQAGGRGRRHRREVEKLVAARAELSQGRARTVRIARRIRIRRRNPQAVKPVLIN